ncbi:hypothetical protein CH063_02860 [Colletotrichum higginsianum]|uniref:Uncharacterized protein n=1 Tax=Colletotrichum higginsianum (strain IMI 349063) TaxID=759273 RepID=H1VQN8_COLHI|nr:hypothetical protein CH063_02860 [Colletotrichum higginsianum]
MKLVTLLLIFTSTTMAARVCRCTYNGEYNRADTKATCSQVEGRMRAKYCETNTPNKEWSQKCVDEGKCWNQ